MNDRSPGRRPLGTLPFGLAELTSSAGALQQRAHVGCDEDLLGLVNEPNESVANLQMHGATTEIVPEIALAPRIGHGNSILLEHSSIQRGIIK